MMVSHEELAERLDHGSERFAAIEVALAKIALAVEPIPAMQEELTKTRELVEAWSAVKTVGRFLKWSSGIIAALTAIGVALKVLAIELWRAA